MGSGQFSLWFRQSVLQLGPDLVAQVLIVRTMAQISLSDDSRLAICHVELLFLSRGIPSPSLFLIKETEWSNINLVWVAQKCQSLQIMN